MVAGVDYSDIHAARKAHLDGMARQGRLMAPITWLLRGLFALARLVGLEYPLFRLFFRPMVGMFDAAIDKAFVDYTPDGHDVFVCSYFKSGTNWVMHLVQQIAHRGEAEFDDILDVIPWADCPAQPTTISLRDERPWRQSPTGLRGIKTHARAQFVPYSEKARYICVIRDPKDTIVSGYHFFGSMLLGPLIPSVATWVRHCTSPEAVFHPWPEFVAGFWPWRNRDNVLFLTYEQLQRDREGTIRSLAEFMAVNLTEDQVARIAGLTSFDHMKTMDHKFYPGEVTPFARPGGKMMRSGKQGNSGELLTPAQQQHIDDWCREQLAKLGCDFPYNQHYGRKNGQT